MQIEINLNDLCALSHATAKNDLRDQLIGVNLSRSERGNLVLTASDGKILASFETSKPVKSFENVTIKKDAINLLKRAARPKSVNIVTVTEDGIAMGDLKLTSFEAFCKKTYEQWQNAIPTGEPSGEVAGFNFKQMAILDKVACALNGQKINTLKIINNGYAPTLVQSAIPGLTLLILPRRGV